MGRVLLFSNLFPSTGQPTRGIFNLHRFGALARQCETRIVVPRPWWSARSGRSLLAVPAEDAFGIPASFPAYWSVPRATPLHGRALYTTLRSPILELRREFPFDAILSAYAYPDGVAAAHLAREIGCPVVSMVLGSDMNVSARQRLLKGQIRSALTASQRVVAVSQALAKEVRELGVPADKVVVQHNGVDGERFAVRSRDEARQTLGLAADRRLVVYVGNLKGEKGVDVLINAMGALRMCGREDVDLALVGDGDQRAALEAQVERLGLRDRIRFCGRRPYDEIPAWITASDTVCLPSYREGCPNVVLEALASGRPVVASNVGGIPELLNARNGVLVPAGQAPQFATGLATVLGRAWNPDALRATAPYLSWDQFGATLYRTITESIAEWSAERPGRVSGRVPAVAPADGVQSL